MFVKLRKGLFNW